MSIRILVEKIVNGPNWRFLVWLTHRYGWAWMFPNELYLNSLFPNICRSKFPTFTIVSKWSSNETFSTTFVNTTIDIESKFGYIERMYSADD